MENASKALIIAGAILLSILIISLGIMIFNQAKGAMDTSSIDELELQQFNSKFTQYEGTAVRGSTVNTMLQAVVANNMAQEDNARKVEVSLISNCFGGTGATDTIQDEGDNSAKKVVTGATYIVKCHIDSTGSDKGLVSKIGVVKKDSNHDEKWATEDNLKIVDDSDD